MNDTANPIDVGTRRQLLFDDAFTASREGFQPVMNPAIRHEPPVLLPARPWERLAIWRWCSVMMGDQGEYRMWYDAYGQDPAGLFRWVVRLCYATSHDGVNWERPDLGAVEFEGGRNNNIVFEGLGNTRPLWGPITGPDARTTYKPNFGANGAVFKDPAAPPEKRYKYAFNDSHATSPQTSSGGGQIYGAVSPDGIRWRPCKREPIMPWYHDGPPSCFWDERIGKYVMYVRWDVGRELIDGKWIYPPWVRSAHKSAIPREDHEFVPAALAPGEHVRAIGRTEGDDFENLPAPRLIVTADEHDDFNLGLYHNAAVKYPYAENAYFLFPGAFYGENRATPDTIDVQMATSRDGIQFRRWREPFVRLGMAGAFDSAMIDMGVGILRRGNELLMYYGGSRFSHGHTDVHRNPGLGGIGMVRLRLDGFVSQDAPATGGLLTTVPLRFEGNRLVLNMDGSANGAIRVDLLDEQFRPLKGFSGPDADVLYGNDIARPVTWKGSPDLSALEGRPVRLRFSAGSLKLYAFQFLRGE